MQLFGFYLGLHDSNVCALRDGQVRYRKFERMSARKHQRAKLEDIRATCLDWGIQPDYVAFSDGNRNGLGQCPPDELFCEVDNLDLFPRANQTICLDHHFAHALSGWPGIDRPSSFRAVSIDGRGDNGLSARAFRIGEGTDASLLFESGRFNVGLFFQEVGSRLGLRGAAIDLAGKVMGLQAYAAPDDDFVAQYVDAPVEGLPRKLMRSRFGGLIPADTDGFFNVDNPVLLSWLSSCHAVLGAAVLRVFERVAAPGEQVDFSGGCAQNSVFNELLARRYSEFTVSCHPYDGGLSFGCLDFLIRLLDAPRPDASSYPFMQDDEDVGFAEPDVQAGTAELIAEGKVVGWMQGRGEVGPRALGHRSILFDPRQTDAKDVLNDRVKHREPWRPFAASVALANAADWFELSAPSPWMQRALVVREERRALVPGVVHEDGTCRAQTVDADDAELASFVGVIEQFGAMTGVPLVLNTSLNSGGEPIYATRRQGIALLATGRLDALCVGNELIIG
jgi:carbamoyltransferase